MARLVSFPNSFTSCHSTVWRENSYRQNTRDILGHSEYGGNPLLVTSQSRSQSKILRINELEKDFSWTFSYGANMSQDTLTKRGVSPSESMPAVLEDHYVAFNHRGGYANLMPFPPRSSTSVSTDPQNPILALGGVHQPVSDSQPDKYFLPRRSAHGVLHRITERDLAALRGYEVGYEVRILEVTTYSGECIQAKCFVSMNGMRTAELAPTTRYLRLLQQGAKMRNVDACYVAWLMSLPSIDSKGRTPNYFATSNDIVAKIIVGLSIVVASLLYFAVTCVRP